MTAIMCPKCEEQHTYKSECRPCKGTGVRRVIYKAVDETLIEGQEKCLKCRGQGFIIKTRVIKNEMVYVHHQENDPPQWVCKKCGFHIYTKRSDEMFPKPEVQLPSIDAITLNEDKPNKEVVKDYIRRRFR